MSEKDLELLIMELTLKNALKYKGSPMSKTIIGGILGKHPEFRSNAKRVKEIVDRKVSEISTLTMDQIYEIIRKSFPDILESNFTKEKHQKQLPRLENATKGKIVLRLPPEPSGYLHIGHAYAGYINFLYKEEYRGKLILRFEDTNPKKVKSKFYDVIKEAYDFLGITYDKIIYESDNLGYYIDQGKFLITNGSAYVCFCDLEQTRANRLSGKECKHRHHEMEENLEFWDQFNSNFKEGDAVLRLKADMTSSRETLRDPTIMRIVDFIHPRVGDKFRVYPLYDFAVSIEDAKVTHVLRSEEFLPKIPLQNLIREYLKLPNPEFKHFSRLKVKNTPVRKRVIRDLIDKNIILDWNDPRLSTIFGLRNRGIRPETMRELVYELRLSSSQSEIDWPMILSINRKVLDPLVRRFFAVIDPIKLSIDDIEAETIQIKNHPKDPRFGSRSIKISNDIWLNKSDLLYIQKNKTVRLKDFTNIDILEISDTKIIGQKSSKMEHNVPKIQWVPKKFSIPLELRKINDLYIFNEKYEEKTINPESMIISNGFIEKNISDLKKYDTLQLERIGFACVEKILKQKVYLNLT